MMMKVALLLLALAAPMISATSCRESNKAAKTLANNRDDCPCSGIDLTTWNKQGIWYEFLSTCNVVDCPAVKAWATDYSDSCLTCPDLKNLAENHGKAGYVSSLADCCPAYPVPSPLNCEVAALYIGSEIKAWDSCELGCREEICNLLVPEIWEECGLYGPREVCNVWNGGNYDKPDYGCKIKGRNYEYGNEEKYWEICEEKAGGIHYGLPYSYVDEVTNELCGYGIGYDRNLCEEELYPVETYEYIYATENCPEYGPEPVYEPKDCPICEVYDWKADCNDASYCWPDEYAFNKYCQDHDLYPYEECVYDASSSAATGDAGAETTVATVSYVLIAIAAALFLASIAFCAIGRRERKAAAGVDNAQMNIA